MRELSITEMELIAGANDIATGANIGGAFGGAAGVSYGMGLGVSGSALAGFAGAGAAAGAGLGAAAAAGFAAGNWLNQNTDIQNVISDMLPDPSGTDYSGNNYN